MVASPVVSDGLVYVGSSYNQQSMLAIRFAGAKGGSTLVISHDASPEVLALNRLDDSFSASAAVVGRELFLRGERNLYCIAEEIG